MVMTLCRLNERMKEWSTFSVGVYRRLHEVRKGSFGFKIVQALLNSCLDELVLYLFDIMLHLLMYICEGRYLPENFF